MDTTRDYCTKSETERQVPYDITYIWNLKYDTNQLIYEAKIELPYDLAIPFLGTYTDKTII